LLCVLAVSGCDKLTAVVTPAADRVNQAFPLSDEVSLAVSRYLDAAARDGNVAAKEQVGKRVQLRALACTAALSIGRFDTPQDIRSKPVDAECLKAHDAELGEWIGLQRVASALSRPALVPLAELGAPHTLPSYEEPTVGIVTSAQSNVALVQGHRSAWTAVRLPDGKAFHTFSAAGFNRNDAVLSPNGRLMLAPLESSRGVQVYEVESGALLWRSDKYRALVTWLPEAGALVLTRGAPDSGTVLLDLATGRSTSYAAAIRSPSWAIAVPGDSERRLVGGDAGVALMAHVKERDGGLTATQLQFWPVAKSFSAGRAFLMSQGSKVVYPSHPGLAWLDLGSGQTGFWDMSALRANAYAQVSDTTLFFAVPKPGSGYVSEGRVLDVDAATMAPVPNYVHNAGLILPLSPRLGYMRRGNGASTVGTVVDVGEAVDLQQVIAAANLELQLAKLKQAQAQAQQDQSASDAMLTHVPPNAQVDVIGVYESRSGVHGGNTTRAAGPVRVTVTPSAIPLVLVLSSYEPVRWVVDNPGGRKISAVLLASYHESMVYGAGAAPVLKIGRGYAYQLDSPQYRELKATVARYVPNAIRTFQGSYSGEAFTVTAF